MPALSLWMQNGLSMLDELLLLHASGEIGVGQEKWCHSARLRSANAFAEPESKGC